jgi:reactive intermediate/imine deaminase
MKRTLVNPSGTEGAYRALHYSQGVRVGDTIWISGQAGSGPKGIVEGCAAQTRLAFENLKKVLLEAGADLGDVVELTSFHTDMGDFKTFMAVKDEFFPENYPAWTAVGIQQLAHPKMLVEIRAVAVVGSAEVEAGPL